MVPPPSMPHPSSVHDQLVFSDAAADIYIILIWRDWNIICAWYSLVIDIPGIRQYMHTGYSRQYIYAIPLSTRY
jgi:hypothetical protein